MRVTTQVVSAVVASFALAGSILPLPALAAEPEQAEEAAATDGFHALSTFPEFASMTDSADTNAPLVLQGAVEQITGAAMPGAQVLLWAWPSNDTVRSLPIGGELELTPMARTVADDTGDYVLRTPVTDLLRALAGPDGLDLQLDVFHADRHYTYLTQATPTPEGAWIREITGLVEPVGEAVKATSNLLDLTLDRSKAAVEEGLGIASPPRVATEFRKPVPPGCTPFQKVGVRPVWETVATAVARGGAVAEVLYEQGARTESSTGASLGGAFTINGSRSRTYGLEIEFEPEKSTLRNTRNVDYRVLTEHVVLRRSCATDFRGGEAVLHITSPVGATTGGVDPVESAEKAFSCTPGDGRTVPARARRVKASTERAATVEAGFSFSPIEGSGFTGRALSGYSKKVVVAFTFPGIERARRFWCGHTGPPGAPGQRVQGLVK
ncbi:MAG: hypothetical protein ACT4QF_14210 [Sporichthyaceae bacterium]